MMLDESPTPPSELPLWNVTTAAGSFSVDDDITE